VCLRKAINSAMGPYCGQYKSTVSCFFPLTSTRCPYKMGLPGHILVLPFIDFGPVVYILGL
jgi:hypothetical protein